LLLVAVALVVITALLMALHKAVVIHQLRRQPFPLSQQLEAVTAEHSLKIQPPLVDAVAEVLVMVGLTPQALAHPVKVMRVALATIMAVIHIAAAAVVVLAALA
jgi:hypothetical protein